jgi:hypothetical protein
MSTQIQRRRGTTAEHSTFTGVEGEITVDTTKDTAVVHDGTTVGGHPLQKQYPPLGSAAAPTYTFTGDTNTGIYSPGADQVAISTGGSGRLFVDASGKISIGHTATTGTNTQLEVAGGSATELKVSAQSASNANFRGIRFGITGDPNDYSGIRFQQNSGELRTEAGFAGWGGFQTFYTDGLERLRITSAGLVGIGTSSPGSYWAGVDNLVIADSGDAGLAIKSGTGNYGTIAFTDTVSTTNEGYIQYDHNLNSLKFGTNSTNALFIDSSQRVGIGTTDFAPASSYYDDLVVKNATAGTGCGVTIVANATNGFSAVDFADTDAAGRGRLTYSHSDDSLRFDVAGSEALRLDSSRRLLVGTSTARTNLFNSTVAVPLQVEGTGTSSAGISVIANPGATAGNGPAVVLGKSRGSAVGGTTVVASGDELGVLTFQGSDGSEFVEAARISAEVDGTPGANDMPGRLVFFTTADGASARTERMRITSDAYVRLASGTGGIQFNGDTAAANALDDYEEGTFSPTLSASGATFGYSFSTGRYTKIGNSVTVHGRIILSSASGGSGTVTLTGLPFAGAPAIGGNNIGQQGIIGRSGGFAGDVPDSLEIKEGVTEASIYYRASANAATSLLDYSDLGSTAYFLFTLTYRTTN